MYKIIRALSAREDVKNIARYIARDNPFRAISFTQELLNSVEKALSLFPESGSKQKNCFLLAYKGYNIFYDVNHDKEVVEILFIKNAAQFTAYDDLME